MCMTGLLNLLKLMLKFAKFNELKLQLLYINCNELITRYANIINYNITLENQLYSLF